ncbi:chloride channel protein [Lichenibacterium minor]|uniref:Chloride channel protein n=1 Tax=Lichenibacterium minor TaxID=2316528 RepID=A0A4Q2UB69_9HYPH|nr:chloride channel protein [Lichenibacterium minor]RYC33268.1 chloride channel protein [Lichenibacterium minor]
MPLPPRRRRTFRRSLRLRALRIWLPRVRRRSFFLFGGIAVGGLAVAMALLADKAQALFAAAADRAPSAPFLVTPLGFALSAWLARRYFPNSGGSGIPQVIAAHQIADPAQRQPLVSLKVAFGKILLLLLGLACGASTGREGPTVQVGASVMYALGRLAPHRQPGLLIAGSAAGIAAAFNAPLAGIIFGIEEMSRSFEERTSGLILGTVIAAGLTSLALVKNYTYFGVTADEMPFGAEWLAVPVIAAAGGLFGGIFSRILIAAGRGFPGAVGAAIKARPVLFAALCGLGVALCGAGAANSVFGTGYDQAKAILYGTSSLPASFGPMKFLATVLSSISGIPGGIFAPSLAVGAGLAADLHGLLPMTPIGVLTILGMVSYLSGVVQAPITSFVIVDEMTQNHGLVIPIMICAIIANAVSKSVHPHGVYHSLSRNFMPVPVAGPSRDGGAARATGH